MAVRLYAALVVLACAALLLAGADRAGYLRLPWRGLLDGGAQYTALGPQTKLDLESGEQGSALADLLWGSAGRGLPYLAPAGNAAMAAAGEWDSLDAAGLAALTYDSRQYSAWGPDAPVRRGAVFALRTGEGNYAKLRVAAVLGEELRLEWLLYRSAVPAAAALSAAVAAPHPRRWMAARDEALAAYREQRYQEALDACGRAVDDAEQLGAPDHALALVSCGSLQDLHARATRQVEDWLKRAVAISSGLEQGALVTALGPGETLLKQRCLRALAVYYRDRKRPDDAAQKFALAIEAARALPPPESDAQRLALRADLLELGKLLAQLGYVGTARAALDEARSYYLKTEPAHPALQEIEALQRRLAAAGK